MHELRLFLLELGELVHDDYQMPQWLLLRVRVVKLHVVIDVVHAVRLKQVLTAKNLALDGSQRAEDHALALQRIDHARRVRQVSEIFGGSAALIVNQDKLHFRRAVIDGQGKDEAL